MRIGLLGGTFDPIHSGHLYLARKVLKKLSLDKIIFIPTHLPPHKIDVKITPARHRYNMLRLAIAGNKRFKASDIEIKRRGRSYSVETLRQVRKRYGDSTEIFFITGSDSLQELDKWKDLRGILRLCSFVVVKRPSFPIKSLSPTFIALRIDAKDISSTGIRNRVREGSAINKMVPKKVRDYIKRHKLYQR